MPIISIFGNSDVKKDSAQYKDAEKTGKIPALSGFHIATGG